MLIKCRVCEEKEKRIADLKSQLEVLKELIYPSARGSLPIVNLEANALLDGGESVTPDIVPDSNEALEEANRILTGTY